MEEVILFGLSFIQSHTQPKPQIFYKVWSTPDSVTVSRGYFCWELLKVVLRMDCM